MTGSLGRLARAILIVLVLTVSLALLPYLGLPYQPLQVTAMRLASVLYHDGCPDYDHNGIIEAYDIGQVALRWTLTAANPDPDNDPNTPNYGPEYDLEYDGVIDMLDIMDAAENVGEFCDD